MDEDTDWINNGDDFSSIFDRMEVIKEEVNELVKKYKEVKDAEGLNKRFSELQQAPQDDEDIRLIGYGSDLAELLWYRYWETAQVDDLNDAINKMEIDVAGSMEKEGYEEIHGEDMAILARMLWARYENSLDPADMDDALFRTERAVFVGLHGDEDDSGERQDLLVDLLSKRFHITNNLLDLDAAIDKTEKILEKARFKKGDRKWVKLEQALAKNWETRAQRTNHPKDAKRALKKARMVVSNTKKKNPQWAERHELLARTIWSHALMTRNATDGAEALSLLSSVVTRSTRYNLDNPSIGKQ